MGDGRQLAVLLRLQCVASRGCNRAYFAATAVNIRRTAVGVVEEESYDVVGATQAGRRLQTPCKVEL